MTSWLRHNPDYEHWFWTDSGTRHTLRQYYPTWLTYLYDSYQHAINRADVRKYVLLYLYGGIYADLDTECLRTIDSSITNHSSYGCILGQEPDLHRAFLYKKDIYVTTSFIACRPRHPFMRRVIEALPAYAANALTSEWNYNILNSTGPTFFTEVVEKYLNSDVGKSERILIADAEWFVPTYDPINLPVFQLERRLKCASRLPYSKICESLTDVERKNKPSKRSYTVHHWLHSWAANFIAQGYVSVERFLSWVKIIK